MPKDNGVEILKRIKKDKILKMMPVLMLTTTDDPEEVNRCYSLGCSNYITKPVKYSKFVEIIKLLGIVINLVAVPKLSVEKQLL